jgi:hypothetical protein
MQLDEAVAELFADDFDPDSASIDEPAVRKTLSWGETVGTLVKQGLLNRDLVHDLWWVKGVWARVGPSALRQREKFGEPRLFENLEALAESAP